MHQCPYAPVCRIWCRYVKNPQTQRILRIQSFPPLARPPCTLRHRRLQKLLSTLDGYLPDKFSARAPFGMACRLFRFPYVLHRVQIFGRTLHVQNGLQVYYFYCVLKPLPKCTNVPSLLPLFQNFTNSEDPTEIKISASGTCTLHPWGMANPRARIPHGDNQPTEFCWRASIGSACSTWQLIFLQGFTRRHVERATCNRSVRNWYRLLSIFSAHRTNPHQSRSDHPFRLHVPKCSDR